MDDLSAYYSHFNLPSIVPTPPVGVALIPIILTHSIYLPKQASIGARDELRMLFVAGLPEDVYPREIYSIFRLFPGYETSHLRTSDGAKPFAFVVFSDLQSAVAVLQALNGMVFDLEKHYTLYIYLAKSNPKSKRLRTDDCWEGFKKTKSCSTTPESGIANVVGRAMTIEKFSHAAEPCPTLFIANMGQNCTESELVQVLPSYLSYSRFCIFFNIDLPYDDDSEGERGVGLHD